MEGETKFQTRSSRTPSHTQINVNKVWNILSADAPLNFAGRNLQMRRNRSSAWHTGLKPRTFHQPCEISIRFVPRNRQTRYTRNFEFYNRHNVSLFLVTVLVNIIDFFSSKERRAGKKRIKKKNILLKQSLNTWTILILIIL